MNIKVMGALIPERHISSMRMENETEKGFGLFVQTIPWPWHLGLALAAYLILHILAGREIPMPGQSPEEVALYTHRLIWQKAAEIFQYIVPAIFSVLTVLSFRRAGKMKVRKLR